MTQNNDGQYGADAVRWFILSDSPPEKDVQWSDAGVSANKFLQKLWNLNYSISNIKRETSDKDQKDFIMKVTKHAIKQINQLMILDLTFQWFL